MTDIKNIDDVALMELIGRVVVVDVQEAIIFIGTLIRVARDSVVLENADVHDCEQGYSSKELYVVNAKNAGFTANRKKVYISMHKIVAISALDDIIVD
jgi:hypothetical protein